MINKIQVQSTAIYPGTFDPITFGHLNIMKRASKIFKHVIVAIDNNNLKKTLFTCKIRAKMIKYELKNNKLKNIEVKIYKGLLVKFVLKNNSKIIIRGLRSIQDFEYELKMSSINKLISPKIETIFLPTTNNKKFISSSIVKEIASLKGNLKQLISNKTRQYINKKYR